MVGELTGGMRWLIWDAHRKTEQIDDIQTQLRDGAMTFSTLKAADLNHSERLTKLETEKVSRLEKLTKRWAAILLPPITALAMWWATGSLDAALKILDRFPK